MSNIFKGEITNISDFNKKIEDLLEKVPLYYDKNGIWYKWNSESFSWEKVDETDILLGIKEETEIANISQNFISSQIINGLKMSSRKRRPRELRENQIQFKDKIIDIETGDMIKASPKYFSFNPIDWEIGETEETPIIDRFITEWVGSKYKKMMYQWIAYQLIPSYPIHRIMMLNGSGRNGKSTFIDLMKKFIGEKNYTAGDFESVFQRRFGTSILYKKLSVLMPEINFGKIRNTATFKNATGGDSILIEFKNKTAFTIKSYAKATISTNSLPVTMDKTDAFYRRIIVINFPNNFKEKFNILEQIPEKEFNNLAKKSITLLKEIIKEGKFDNEESIDQKREKYERLSNPLSTFIEEEVLDMPDVYVPKREFLIRANEWLKKKNHRVLTNKEISQFMKESYQEGWGSILTQDGNRRSERVWLGIGWKGDEVRVTEETI